MSLLNMLVGIGLLILADSLCPKLSVGAEIPIIRIQTIQEGIDRETI
jgi:hypothetical protein